MTNNGVIGFADLKRQYETHSDGLLKAFLAVCKDVAFSGGKYTEVFEKEFAKYCGASYASGLNNGTSALHMAMAALNIGTGDEVIVPANTFIATAWGVSYTGGVPVFVDCTSDTWEIDVNKIEKSITRKTKAIIGVHLYGQPFDVGKTRDIAKANGLFLVEDCAQAHGALYNGERVGKLCTMGCFSFYPGKNLGAYGEAGMVTTNNLDYISRINILKSHGSIQRYYHDMLGYNYRMDGIQAAILSYKLKFLDDWTRRRQAIAKTYVKEIKNQDIKMQAQHVFAESVYHLFVVTVKDKEKFKRHLEDRGIGYGEHYPVPCHLQKAYRGLGYKKGDMPNAEYLSEHCISLPMFPELTDDEISRVIEACNSYVAFNGGYSAKKV